MNNPIKSFSSFSMKILPEKKERNWREKNQLKLNPKLTALFEKKSFKLCKKL